MKRARGRGLLVGLQCVPPVAEMLARIHEQRLLCIPAGDNVLRLVPPLTITDSEIDEAISKLLAVAEALSDTAYNSLGGGLQRSICQTNQHENVL